MIDLFRSGRRSLVLVAAALALATSACNDDDDNTATGPGGEGGLRVVHAVSDGPNLDVQVDDAVLSFTNVPFGQVRPTTGYLTIREGAHRLRTYATGTPTVISDIRVTISATTPMTAIITGRVTGGGTVLPLVIADDAAAPAAGQIRVRVVHAASTAGAVDVYVTAPGAALPATATLGGLAYRSVSQYFEMPSAQYQVRVYPAGNRTTAVINVTTPFAVPAGNVITAVAIDPPIGGAPSIVLLADRLP